MKQKTKVFSEQQIAGLTVLDMHGLIVGTIKRAFEDKDSESGLFLEIIPVPETPDIQPENILLPSGFTVYNEIRNILEIPDLERETILKVPPYKTGDSVIEYEYELMRVLVPQPGKIARNPDEFFHFQHYVPGIDPNINS